MELNTSENDRAHILSELASFEVRIFSKQAVQINIMVAISIAVVNTSDHGVVLKSARETFPLFIYGNMSRICKN